MYSWVNATGDGPSTITLLSLVYGLATITSTDISSSVSKGFVTDKDTIVFDTDDGEISYNFIEELGLTRVLTFGGSKYNVKFVFAGSGWVEISPSGGAASGGDPHIIPLGRKTKMYDLPCKHGANYQYIAYETQSESVVINVMTQIVSIDDPKNTEKNEIIKKFISKCRDYIKYMYICYTNKLTGIKEELCYDLFKMNCVNLNLKNFDSLAYNCLLPVSKKYVDKLKNIKLSKKLLKNKKIIGYKSKNKEHQIIKIYTQQSKFELTVGKAQDNPVFGTYMSVDKYPHDTLYVGKGLLVDPTKYNPIKDLRSRNKQF